VRIGQLYGATEIGSITYGDPRTAAFDPASVGRAMQGVEIRVESRDGNATPLDPGSEGQICIRAESMFAGYVGETSSPLIDGFFPTGDLGRLDVQGNLTITGRLKLLIDVGGLKVNPMEVEDVLVQHPAVAACVVVPVPQSQTLSRLKAVVTPRNPDLPPQADELRQFARRQLSPHKVPRIIEVRTTLPRSPTGKILRHLVDA
jgi:acyl-CoA synthetase (AMP-forming)/AMP-acid ligase II